MTNENPTTTTEVAKTPIAKCVYKKLCKGHLPNDRCSNGIHRNSKKGVVLTI